MCYTHITIKSLLTTSTKQRAISNNLVRYLTGLTPNGNVSALPVQSGSQAGTHTRQAETIRRVLDLPLFTDIPHTVGLLLQTGLRVAFKSDPGTEFIEAETVHDLVRRRVELCDPLSR